MKILIATLSMIVFGSMLSAQSLSPETDTLVWQVGELADLKSDTVEVYSCTFETYPDGTVIWIQKNGTYTTVFEERSVHGNWTDSNDEGELEFRVKFMERTGKIFFGRTGEGVKIRMVFMENDENTMPLEFTVAQITRKI